MADSPSKLKNIQSAGEPSNGLAPGIVEVEGSDGGAIDSSPSPSAAEQNIERRPCDCEASWMTYLIEHYPLGRECKLKPGKDFYCRFAEGDCA